MIPSNLFGKTEDEIREAIVGRGIERYRAAQLVYWLYNQGVASFDAMTNIPKTLRARLAEEFSIQHPTAVHCENSFDGTKKFLFELSDGKRVETVLIPSESDEEGQPKRLTLCLSTQVGCPLDCAFCATAEMKLKRDLTAGEIVGQYLVVQQQTDRRITNLVYMGMGEPMLNYDQVMQSIEIITHEKTCGVSSQRITVSTAGLVDGIERMANEGRKAKLAVSLHTADDALRSQLMPINRKFNLDALAAAIEFYYRKTKRRVTYEYILFDGLNDTPEALNRLVKFVRRTPSKVNIIPFHDVTFVRDAAKRMALRPSPPDRIEWFARTLRGYDITVMMRSSSGKDIHAACGQLAVMRQSQRGDSAA